MVSKKKKGRSKAKKAARKVEEEKEVAEQQGAQDEATLLEDAIKLAAAEKEALKSEAGDKEGTVAKDAAKQIITKMCGHGYVASEEGHIIEDFLQTFMSRFKNLAAVSIAAAFYEATTTTQDKYPGVWSDISKLKLVVSLFLFNATQHVLEGDIQHGRGFASFACYMEEMILRLQTNAKVTFSWKTIELTRADERTLVKYLRQHIPCTCLDTKYKEVKSMTKTGVCANPLCHAPDRYRVERSTMLYCTRCRAANYCSRECQKAAWPKHKSH